MDFWSLLSVWWFLFFLLIIAIWYVFVEIVCGDKYFLRKQLDKYKWNLFDRILHYISWWIIVDGVFIYISLLNQNVSKEIINIFNNSGKLAVILYPLNVWQVQLFLFWIYMFVLIIAVLWMYLWITKIIDKIFLRIEKKTKNSKYFLPSKKSIMWIQVEFNPDLALRNISEYQNGNRKKQECIPADLQAGQTYDFLKKDQRLYRLYWELPLIETQGWWKLSRPKASIMILEATHFLQDGEIWTRWKYKIIQVFTDDKIYFECFDKVGTRK